MGYLRDDNTDAHGNSQVEFPDTANLIAGCRRIAIAEALYGNTSAYWEANIYCSDDGQGDNAALAISEVGLVALAFNHESPRSPYGTEYAGDWESRYLTGLPEDLAPLAEAAADKMYHGFNEHSDKLLVTSAFWGRTGEVCAASEAWPDVFRHGGDMFRKEKLDLEAAVDACQDNYQFDAATLVLLQRLWQIDRKDIKEVEAAEIQAIRDSSDVAESQLIELGFRIPGCSGGS